MIKQRKCFSTPFIIHAIILLFFNLTMSGCYSFERTAVQDDQSIKIYKVETVDGDTLDFPQNKFGYATLSDGFLRYTNNKGEELMLPKSKVKFYFTKKYDVVRSVGVVAIAVVAGFIYLFHDLGKGVHN